MKKLVMSVMASFAIGASALADVWNDCTAWYIGGKGTVGEFADGDMTDIRHAAITNSPTHGGTRRSINVNVGISNLCEDVYSAASGRWFENQRTIHFSQRDFFDSGTYKVYENALDLPFAATNENYTLLTRVKLDETQPTNSAYVYVIDSGYTGNKDLSTRWSFRVRYHPQTEEIGLLYNNGSGKEFISPTNDVCKTLRGKWLELSVTLETLKKGYDDNGTTKDKCRMRVGVAAEGLERTYVSKEFGFPTGQSVSPRKLISIGGTSTGNKKGSTSTYPTRGSYQMISYWERVLTDAEILEAFKRQGPDGTAAQAPALLKVGDAEWSGDVFSGTFEGATKTVSTDLQDLGDFPAALAAGQSLSIPFTVPTTCTNLNQLVRVGVASGSGTLKFAVDAVESEAMAATAGATATALFERSHFTEGSHTLTISRTDSGDAPLRLSAVEISGSWRIGWINNSASEMDGSTTVHVLEDLTTNKWNTVRSTVKLATWCKLTADVNADDAARRRIVLRAKPFSMPGSVYDWVVLANDVERFRHTVSSTADDRYDPGVISFRPGELNAGENVFTFKTDNMTSGKDSWYKFDYFEFEVGDEPKGAVLLIR